MYNHFEMNILQTINRLSAYLLEIAEVGSLNKNLPTAHLHLNKTFTTPERPDFGFLSTNIALQVAASQSSAVQSTASTATASTPTTTTTSPHELAKKIAIQLLEKIKNDPKLSPLITDIQVAGPGFINFIASDQLFLQTGLEVLASPDDWGKNDLYLGKTILAEFTDPNPFKVFHIGHLMSNCIGESISRILELSGAKVNRLCYQGDVGMHIAKTIWAWRKELSGKQTGALITDNETTINDQFDYHLQEFTQQPLEEKVTQLGKWYSIGAEAYKSGSAGEIEEIKTTNKIIYQVCHLIDANRAASQTTDHTAGHTGDQAGVRDDGQTTDQAFDQATDQSTDWAVIQATDQASAHTTDQATTQATGNATSLTNDEQQVFQLYKLGRQWSLEAFDIIYQKLGTKFVKHYFESQVEKAGEKIVRENLGTIFEESKGAIIFPGEKYGLHSRVFINSEGLPTYEAKELALAIQKNTDFQYDQSIIITGNEVNEYFKVVMRALQELHPDIVKKTHHVGHGMLRLPEGKMSSRTGNVITGEALLDLVTEKIKSAAGKDKITPELANKLAVSALKFALLKGGIGKDVVFNLEESTSLTGASGVYLQYTHARVNSVLKKGSFEIATLLSNDPLSRLRLDDQSRLIFRELYQFPQIILQASSNIAPSLVANYLLGIAQKFNTFYADQQIVGSENENTYLLLTFLVKQTLKTGLYALGATAVDEM